MVEAISLAKELNDMHGLASTLYYAASFAYHERNLAEVERLASDVIELSTRHHFAHWLAIGSILRGWARSASGDTVEGISWIEDGIRDYRATGANIGLSYLLGMKAEALHLADRTSEALEAIKEAEALVERFEERFWCAELHRLRAIFLAAMGADETKIEASLLRSYQNRKGAEVDFARETRRRNLRRISQAKSERVRRTWIPTTPLVTSCFVSTRFWEQQVGVNLGVCKYPSYRLHGDSVAGSRRLVSTPVWAMEKPVL